jgi:hypothetical protein
MLNQQVIINGQDFYTSPCKFEAICKKTGKFNPALKLVNKYGVEHLNSCVMGGGCGCVTWRTETDKEIGWNTEKFINQRRY